MELKIENEILIFLMIEKITKPQQHESLSFQTEMTTKRTGGNIFLRYSQEYGGAKPVNMIPTIPLLLSRSRTIKLYC